MPEEIVVKEDLVKRVSEVKPEEKKDDATFNVNDIEKIEDPQAKEYAQKAYKSLESGYTKKFQALAEERKTWETKKTEGENWTTEKVHALTKDPNFLQAAQDVASQTKTDDYSTLTDGEKEKVANAERLAKQALVAQMEVIRFQQDESNKTKYANYDPKAVDVITDSLATNRMKATREHLWKVIDYEPAVKRAYELGLKDKEVINEDKVNSMSMDGFTVTSDENIPKKEKGENDRNYFSRIGRFVMTKKAESGQVRK